MPYLNVQPAEQLKDYVKCYWYAERNLTAPDYSFEILPDSYFEMVFCEGEQPVYYSKYQQSEPLPEWFIVGLLEKPLTITSKGKIRAVGVRFFAWGFHELMQLSLLDAPITQWPHVFETLKEHLKAAITSNQQDDAFRILEHFLLGQLNEKRIRHSDIRIIQLAGSLYKGKGMVDIKEKAKNAFLSERQYSRLFSNKLGVGPKALAKKIRFQHVRDAIFENPDINLTELAYEYEFTDQSHFINEFKGFAGRSPGTFAREMKTLKTSMAQYNVRFLQ